MAGTIAAHCRIQGDMLPCDIHFDALRYQTELDQLKSKLLGCVRYIASLSRVDGFVLLDKRRVVHGFGVEARADTDLTEIYMAGDALASSRLLRPAPLSQFGTRPPWLCLKIGYRTVFATRRYPTCDWSHFCGSS